MDGCITKQTFSLYKLIVTGSFYRRYYQKREQVLEEVQYNSKKTEYPYWGSYQQKKKIQIEAQ